MAQTPQFALTPIAAAVSAILYPAAQVVAEENEGAQRGVLEEVIVTARKRTESVQDIPSSIQALGEQAIKEMGATGIADYSRFVPSVNVVSYGNGTDVIVFRGATVDGGGYIAQSTSSMYLDEISITSTGSQPSVRMVDIQRVEALSGPQGTIYGSDAQAGTMRIITNKPKMDTFEAILDLSARANSPGENSHSGSLVLNIPIMEDKLALRLVGFQAKDGGYIDNVFGHTPDTSNINGPDYLPSGFGTLDNADVVEKNWNDSKVSGWRAALRWELNDDWSATVSALHQKTDNGAYNDYDPNVGDLQTVRFNDEFRKDIYDIYSLTIEGDLGFAQLVSATSFYDRDIKEVYDITVYHHYWSGIYCQTYEADPTYLPYYYANPNGTGVVWWPVYCHAPTVEGDYLAAYSIPAQQERFTQEIRLVSQGDTIDWLVGMYIEDSKNSWQASFGYPTSNDYQDSISLDFWEWYHGETFPDAEEHWYSNSSTDWEQTAFFGEAVWHVNEKVDVTAGGRWFDRKSNNIYYVEHPTTKLLDEYTGPGGIPDHKGKESKFVPKLSVAYHPNSDTMLYALWTEGYRPGGTNRTRGEPFFPQHYDPDKITNWEAGMKSTFAEGTVRLNLTGFYMDWSDYQLEIVDPSQIACPGGADQSIGGVCGQPWQAVVANAGDAHIMGFSAELDWAVSDNFVFGANMEWLEAETDSTLDLNGDGFINVQKGNELPVVPSFKGAAWATYYWPVNALQGNGFARLQWTYTGGNNNILEPVGQDFSDPNPQFRNSAYNIGDFRIGIETATWEASIFVNNLTDERVQYTHGTGAFEYGQGSAVDNRPSVSRVYTNRPREYGVRFIKHFGG